MTAITLTSKGQATIPKQIRDLLGVKPSGRITFEVRDGEVILRALGNPAGMLSAAQSAAEMIDIDPEEVEEWRQTISRNAECPCGSGKKFKHCHGAL